MKKIINNQKIKTVILSVVIGLNSCGEWLDVVPEGVATIDMAFNSRVQTLKYLATCYSSMGIDGNIVFDPAMFGGDELWSNPFNTEGFFSYEGIYFAQGMQNATNPLFNYWGSWYQGLRNCNIFLENVGMVPDLPPWERDQWIAEAKVLKAYYHFLLVRQYGPVPLIRENLPIDVDVSKVKVEREPVDDCFQYIVSLLDEAVTGDGLPLNVLDVAGELGRITKPIALALKAKILVFAASPLFNGNDQQATLLNKDGTRLFNTTYDPAKWEKAMVACKEAIEACHNARIMLYEYPNAGINSLTDTIATQMSLRNAFTQRWNSDIIWANTQSIITAARQSGWGLQCYAGAALNPAFRESGLVLRNLGVPLKIASMFYTDHGVPLAEDRTRNINDMYNLRTAKESEKLYVKEGSATVELHFDREPRFYAWVGFDCGIWYGQGRTNDKEELWSLAIKAGEVDKGLETGVGYLAKKYIPYTNVLTSINSYSSTPYPWPIMRISDLYLLYAEAINEAEGPNGANSADMFQYIDAVRARAGLKGVKESWEGYSTRSQKISTQTGMREIIQQERMIELSFEGQRFWDVRRWKTAPEVYRSPIDGWSVLEAENNTYYTPRVVLQKKFGIRDYFWPISNSDLINNPNLVQNIGW